MDYRIGQQIGNYRLVGQIGQGGFADVYLGEHVHLGTQAAIKFLRTRLDASAIDFFKTEARTIAHLEHTNIVRVQDFGLETDGTPYLIMTYAPHGTLRHRHPLGTQVASEQVAIYVDQIASALQYAHNQHIVHRDVKPENLLIGNNQQILLSDFGIALMVQSSRSTGTQDLAGTIAYMAPEQIQTRPRSASDQYALGVLVYEWLCGERPFTGSFTEVAVKHAMVDPKPLRTLQPDLSPAIEHVVMVALAKDPARRFPSVDAFARALGQAVRQTQIEEYSTQVIDNDQTRPRALPAISKNTPRQSSEPIATVQALPTTPSRPFDPTIREAQPKPAEAILKSMANSKDTFPIKPHRKKRPTTLYFIATLALVVVVIAGFLLFSRLGGQPTASSASHTNYYPAETGINQSNVGDLSRKREIELSFTSSTDDEAGTPFYATDERIYTYTSQTIRAFDLTNGRVIWSRLITENSSIYSTTLRISNIDYERGFVYVVEALEKPILYAVNLANGELAWTQPFESADFGDKIETEYDSDRRVYATRPLYADGLVFFGETGRQLLFAVNAQNGELRWSEQLSNETKGSSKALRPYDFSHPSIANGKVYVQIENGQLRSLDAKTGKKAWSISTPRDNWTAPVVANGLIYQLYERTRLVAFDANSGEKRWETPVGESSYSSLAVTDKSIFVSVGEKRIDSHTLKAFSALSGVTLWQSAPVPRQSNGTSLARPVALNGVIFLGVDSYYDQTSSETATDAHLYAFDTNDGSRLWSSLINEKGSTPVPLINNGKLYIPTGEDGIIAEYRVG